MTLRHSLALEMAAFLAWNSAPARPAMRGVVVEANRVHLNSGAVSEGATVYDGDQFATEAGGMLRLRGDATMVDLAEESVMMVRSRANDAQGTEAELRKGTLVFGAGRGTGNCCTRGARSPGYGRADHSTGECHRFKGITNLRTAGTVAVFASGRDGDDRRRSSYRVILDPPEDDPKTKEAVKAGRQRKVFRFLAIGGGAAAAAVVIYQNHGHKRMVSPDRP